MKLFGVFLFFIYLCSAQPPQISMTIIVDRHGGQFRSIQEAINSIPSNNQQWVHVYVKQGTYMETVRVDRQYIFLEGQGSATTLIDYSNFGSPQGSKTIEILADNFVAKHIGFKNNHNYPALASNDTRIQAVTKLDLKAERIQAVAATVSGDKVAFYECSFLGVQDTIWDNAGRHYFSGCYISGCVDFIFGAGQSHYENCVLDYTGAIKGVDKGFITAQGRNSPQETSGFVFLNCKMIGSGQTYLGRAWRAHARVLFYQSEITGVVLPKGWDAWNGGGQEYDLVFAESGCYGAGSDTSQRVPWEKKLSESELNMLTSRSFIDAEGWIGNQP